MSNVFFTSDTHFYHQRILEFCRATRQGVDTQEMTELMIQSWNSVVRPGDRVYHTGDFSFGGKEKIISVKNRLMGEIHLVVGNHDRQIKKSPELSSMFTSIREYRFIKINDQRFALSHFPMARWEEMGKGSIMLFGHCLDESTEVLTEGGWKNRTEVTPNDRIATFNMSNSCVEYHNYLNKIEYPYEGYLNSYAGTRIDFSVTDGHRIIHENNKGSGYIGTEVSKLQSLVRVPTCGLNTKEDYPISDDWLRLYVHVCADGSFENYRKLIRFHLRKQRKIDVLKGLLDRLDINYSCNLQKSGTTKINFRTPEVFRNLDVKPLDRLLLMSLSSRQVNIIMETYRISDGSTTGEHSVQISTSKKCEAELLQEVFVTSGISCNLIYRNKGRYVLSLNTKRTSMLVRRSNIVKTNYQGIVWCLSVPNTAFIIRRGGKVHITGNCHGGYKSPLKSMDIGIDARPDNKMLPWHFDEIISMLKDRPTMDHHDN